MGLPYRNKQKEKWLSQKLFLLLFWPLGFLLSWVSTFNPIVVEKYYSQGLSNGISQILSRISGIFPFSLAEIIIVCLPVGLLISLITSKMRISTFILNVLIFFGIVYFMFMFIWGLNYQRLAFSEIADLKINSVSEAELVQLCEKLTDRANLVRKNLNEDVNGVMQLSGGFERVREVAPDAFAKAVEIYPEFNGIYGKPKPVYFSNKMSYAGISGIYFPFTGEANVNIDIPQVLLPATTSHEMAHQRGFAREDEANYIAWVICNVSSDSEFEYSGTLHALIYAMNALYQNHPDRAREIAAKYEDGVKRDLKSISDYWKRHEGKVEEITSDVNDAYLKSNRQEDGIQSYGRMVDLLLAEQKADPKKRFLD